MPAERPALLCPTQARARSAGRSEGEPSRYRESRLMKQEAISTRSATPMRPQIVKM